MTGLGWVVIEELKIALKQTDCRVFMYQCTYMSETLNEGGLIIKIMSWYHNILLDI